ncbi:MAG: tRNA pseudouridine synthase A, partial [Gemmatimonadetes bacterium]|nr:tRNA pseudouridine synthase A [Gemmatimonadota bacterium]
MTAERIIRLDLEYEGTDFLGWQEQPRGRTVQGELRAALSRFLQQDVQPVGSGRTDAGTHAKGLVAHLRTTSHHEPERFRRALNALLPPDVCVLRALAVHDDFHARFSALGKRYRYRLSERRHALHRRQVWVLPRHLDLEPMQQAAASLIGCHAFSAFCNHHPPPDHFECTISEATWSRVGQEWRFEIVGNRFLRHM